MSNIQSGDYYALGSKTFFLKVAERSMPTIAFIVLAILLERLEPSLVAQTSVVDLGTVFKYTRQGLGALAVFAELLGILVSILEYSVQRIMVDDSSIHLVRGLLSRHETSIPFRRIQSVEIEQSFFYRLMGLGKIVISTTTDMNQPSEKEDETDDEVIPTLDYGFARELADTLSRRAEVERMQVQEGVKLSS